MLARASAVVSLQTRSALAQAGRRAAGGSAAGRLSTGAGRLSPGAGGASTGASGSDESALSPVETKRVRPSAN